MRTPRSSNIISRVLEVAEPQFMTMKLLTASIAYNDELRSRPPPRSNVDHRSPTFKPPKIKAIEQFTTRSLNKHSSPAMQIPTQESLTSKSTSSSNSIENAKARPTIMSNRQLEDQNCLLDCRWHGNLKADNRRNRQWKNPNEKWRALC